MSWLAQCGDRLMPRIDEFFRPWFDAYGRISPLHLSNFSEAKHGAVKSSIPAALEEREPWPCSPPTAVRSGKHHLTIVRAG
jgi:hypothetical protein